MLFTKFDGNLLTIFKVIVKEPLASFLWTRYNTLPGKVMRVKLVIKIVEFHVIIGKKLEY